MPGVDETLGSVSRVPRKQIPVSTMSKMEIVDPENLLNNTLKGYEIAPTEYQRQQRELMPSLYGEDSSKGVTVANDFGRISGKPGPGKEKATPNADLFSFAYGMRNTTEGNVSNFYNDAGGVAIGMGLNLTVQNKNSLKNLVGGDTALYNKLEPYLGKKFSDLTQEDIKNSRLTPQELKALNGYMIAASLESVRPYAGNLSPKGQVILSDIQHYTGTGGLKSQKSKKLGVMVDGKSKNYIADAILTHKATDEDLKNAILMTLSNPTVNPVTAARLKKYLKELS